MPGVGHRDEHSAPPAALLAGSEGRPAQPPAPGLDPFPPPTGKVLKRIPRGARDAAAEQFARTIDKVLNTPEDRGSWRALFAFATCCFSQPSERGGKSRNLTTAVSKQIQRFNEVGIDALADQVVRADVREPNEHTLQPTRRLPRELGPNSTRATSGGPFGSCARMIEWRSPPWTRSSYYLLSTPPPRLTDEPLWPGVPSRPPSSSLRLRSSTQ